MILIEKTSALFKVLKSSAKNKGLGHKKRALSYRVEDPNLSILVVNGTGFVFPYS